MISLIKHFSKITFIFSGICLVVACSTQKDTGINRRLQNLSARYNYIYNSGVLLTEYEGKLSQNVGDSYDYILPVYLMPDGNKAAADKSLVDIATKAQGIIAEKNVSNYLDEAYILLGKANFYQGNYFTSTEYFDYVARTYGADKKRYLEALTWKARSQFQLNNLKEARLILDQVEKTLPQIKKNKAEAFATLAQLSIQQDQNAAAIVQLKAALKQQHTARETSRWNYILGQLYELENNYPQSLDYFTKVVKSNAPFEMYFNANLNRIKLRGLISGEKLNRQEQILALLKDDKNEEYIDQIYFKVAESFAENGDLAKAEEYYIRSAAKSTTNLFQKGVSYLKIADLNFNQRGNYLKARSYYDSAATTLPKTYPGYDAILKKGQNLQYLSDRFQVISFQDSAQMIALLPENDRLTRINKILGPEIQQPSAVVPTTPGSAVNNTNLNDPFAANQSINTFYFSNTAALSTGFSDFRRKWGNRPLEDNWRQSTKSASQVVTQNQNTITGSPQDSAGITSIIPAGRAGLIKQYQDNLPLTPSQLTASNQKIIDSYFEIGSFYQQELNDKEEAARIYELLLERFPNNNHMEAITYSLYRSYEGRDAANAARYRDLVLKNYPGSVYAKAILDPGYSARENAEEMAVQKDYNTVYAGYEKRQYPAVIKQAEISLTTFPSNPIRSQYEYLRAIAIGRTNNVDSLLRVFNSIVTKYPDDQLVTPLVKGHIAFINANMGEFRNRKFALEDIDGREVSFSVQNSDALPAPLNPQANVPKTPATSQAQPNAPAQVIPDPPKPVPAASNDPVSTVPAIKTDGTFTNAPSKTYYFVVNVTDASLTLSSSRFGIGQFNRGNYPDNNLRHQLTELDDDQLIYVGSFESLEAVKRYAEIITPQLRNIMKVPAAKFSSFIISKENFDKMETREKIKQYLTFFTTAY